MNPFYYPLKGESTEEPCNCGEQGHFLSCQNYQPFAEVDRRGQPLTIGYQIRAQSSFESFSRIKLDFKKEWLKPALQPTVAFFNPAIDYDDNVRQMVIELLNIVSGKGSHKNILLNDYLLETYDPLDIEWLNGATVRFIIDSFVEQYTNTVPIAAVPTAVQVPARDYTMNEVWTFAYQYSFLVVTTDATTYNSWLTSHIPANVQANIHFKIADAILKFLESIVFRLLVKGPGRMDPNKLGFLPALTIGFDGKLRVKYINITSKGADWKPIFNMILHYRTTSYDTNYGMSRVVKTVSLLPSEKTDLTIKTYKSSTITRNKAENILDSFTETSAKSLENMLENERNDKTTDTTNEKWDVNLGLDISLTEIVGFPLGIEAGGGYEHSTTNIIEGSTRVLNKAMNKHTTESTRNRKVEINTTTNETYTETSEELVVRHLENINKSRVLNFVYRQLYQEYLAITYLYDVSFEFRLDNTMPPRTIKLTQLPDFLKEICIDQASINIVMKAILSQLWIISDYQNQPQQFIDCTTFDTAQDIKDEKFIPSPCCAELVAPVHHCFPHVLPNLSQNYGEIKVPGIILSAEPHQLPTDDLLCDAILGAGEALDCYNIRLQAEAVRKAELENDRSEQMMRIIELLEDPKLKAELYKKVFGTCCDVPQSGCSCHACQEAHGEPK